MEFTQATRIHSQRPRHVATDATPGPLQAHRGLSKLETRIGDQLVYAAFLQSGQVVSNRYHLWVLEVLLRKDLRNPLAPETADAPSLVPQMN